MTRLLMITTGGTIASGNSRGGGLTPEKNGSEMLPKLKGVQFDVLDLYAADSTDVTPAHWRRLHNAVIENLPEYDGIVILHGTDTMAYTGAVLAFTVDTAKPVILTGSMLPFDEPDSDAPGNIQFAALIAKFAKYPGVNLAFANSVAGGADIIKVSSCEKNAFRRYADFKPERKYRFPEHDGIFPAVVRLTPFTQGTDISRAAENKAGIVIETYCAGGIPDNDITLVISELAKRIPVVISSPCRGGTDLSRYEVGRRALEAGASEAGRRSTECAAVELWLKENQ